MHFRFQTCCATILIQNYHQRHAIVSRLWRLPFHTLATRKIAHHLRLVRLSCGARGPLRDVRALCACLSVIQSSGASGDHPSGEEIEDLREECKHAQCIQGIACLPSPIVGITWSILRMVRSPCSKHRNCKFTDLSYSRVILTRW